MGVPLRILHTADSHIGAALPSRPRRLGPRRGDDLVDSYQRVLAHAADCDVDLVIHAGDVFDRSKPTSRALVAAAEPLLELAVAGIPVVIVPGNHERSVIPGSVLLAHPNIHIISEPHTLTFNLRGTRVAISGFPCLRRDSAKRFGEALEATRWSRTRADVRILAVHQTFESATCGPANYRFCGGDDVVERDTIPLQFDYVAAGHIHRHQTLATSIADGPPIVYAGSPDRVSFAEANEPKGFVMVEASDGSLTPRFIEHDVRPMSVWPLNITGLSRTRLAEEVDAIIRMLPARAIAQLRLTGCSSPPTLRGLRFTTRSREIRPDVLLTVTTQAVELPPFRVLRRLANRRASAFAGLDAPPEQTVAVSPQMVKKLPPGCGVYALYDATARLLYVGKSKNLRPRVRTHLRGKTGAKFFDGWTDQIARIEARAAHSELEALLIEAELIRTLRPPFNRQMRRWTTYCYLRENGQPYRQLEVSRRPTAGPRCFGPFRGRKLAESIRDAVADQFRLALCSEEPASSSVTPLFPEAPAARLCERYYQGLCSGPCADRVAVRPYERAIRKRDALLTGLNESVICDLESELDAEGGSEPDTPAHRDLSRRACTLRFAFDQSATLSEAERLLNGLLVLPEPGDRRKTATLTTNGVHFDILEDSPRDAQRLLARHLGLIGKRGSTRVHRLPKTAVDALCIVARQLRRSSARYRFIGRGDILHVDEANLLTVAFESG